MPQKALSNGWLNRRVAATAMNRESSRSHAVFTLIIESKVRCFIFFKLLNQGTCWMLVFIYLILERNFYCFSQLYFAKLY